MNEQAFMNWSGGKDSALALYKAQTDGINTATLVTSVNSALDRVSMHGVRRELVQQQAIALQLPLCTIELPEAPGMTIYEETVRKMHHQLKEKGHMQGIFGDVFLEDLKQYRVDLLARDGLKCFFPLWRMDSKEVVKEFLQLGFKAIIVCVNNKYLDESFCGRLLDESFIADLPPGVDPCGEAGEYHSFVFDGPNFLAPVKFEKGETVFKEYPAPKDTDDCFTGPQATNGYYFCDLLPV